MDAKLIISTNIRIQSDMDMIMIKRLMKLYIHIFASVSVLNSVLV